jgi:hypothetical protein
MDEGDQPRAHPCDGLGHQALVEGGARLGLDAVDAGAGPGGHLAHAPAEDAGHPDHGVVPGLHQVHEAGLHAGAAGGREGERHAVAGSEQAPEPLLYLVEDGEEGRVEVSDHGLGLGGEHPGVDVGGARAQQQASGQGGARHGGSLAGERRRRHPGHPCAPEAARGKTMADRTDAGEAAIDTRGVHSYLELAPRHERSPLVMRRSATFRRHSGEAKRVKRWLALALGLAIAAGSLWLLASRGDDPPLGKIGDASRAELRRVLEQAEGERR